MRIDLAWLGSQSVCSPQGAATLRDHVEICRSRWGDSFELTRPILIEAAELGMLPNWLALRLLSPEDYGHFAESLAARLSDPDLDRMREEFARMMREHRRAVADAPETAARRQRMAAAGEALQVAIGPHLAEHHARMADATTEDEIEASLAIYRAATDEHYDACRRITAEAMAEVHRAEERLGAPVAERINTLARQRERSEAQQAVAAANALADALGLP